MGDRQDTGFKRENSLFGQIVTQCETAVTTQWNYTFFQVGRINVEMRAPAVRDR